MLEDSMPAKDSATIRREYIAEETGTKLDMLGNYSLDDEQVVHKNVENMIGCVQIPVGIAGPLNVHGEAANGNFWIPLATTEGALIASINRGTAAITAAGGADVRIFQDGMTRAPVFAARDIPHAAEAIHWIENNFELIKQEAEKTTTHGKLIDITTYSAGTSVYVRMCYSTGDAMGMNMTTLASEKASDLIAKKTGLTLIASSGNLCCDKKPAAVNMILGRGKTVSAGIFLSKKVIENVLKTTSEKLIDVNTRKNLVGSARAGGSGFNAHVANIAAAIFIATGQDPAHVVEASNALTTIEEKDDGVYASVTLPSLQVGTVGGGTGLSCQNEALAILGCIGDNTANKFAEIIAATALAGELSLLAALATGDLGKAHQKLGRDVKC